MINTEYSLFKNCYRNSTSDDLARDKYSRSWKLSQCEKNFLFLYFYFFLIRRNVIVISTCQAQANSVYTKRESEFHKRTSSKNQHAIQSDARKRSLGETTFWFHHDTPMARCDMLLFMCILIIVKRIIIINYTREAKAKQSLQHNWKRKLTIHFLINNIYFLAVTL